MNQSDADVIVIGSGFGGAVTACRLAQAGAKVLVLERGRRWTTETYPRAAEDPWLFDIRRPHKKNGWLDVRFFSKVIVARELELAADRCATPVYYFRPVRVSLMKVGHRRFSSKTSSRITNWFRECLE